MHIILYMPVNQISGVFSWTVRASHGLLGKSISPFCQHHELASSPSVRKQTHIWSRLIIRSAFPSGCHLTSWAVKVATATKQSDGHYHMVITYKVHTDLFHLQKHLKTSVNTIDHWVIYCQNSTYKEKSFETKELSEEEMKSLDVHDSHNVVVKPAEWTTAETQNNKIISLQLQCAAESQTYEWCDNKLISWYKHQTGCIVNSYFLPFFHFLMSVLYLSHNRQFLHFHLFT